MNNTCKFKDPCSKVSWKTFTYKIKQSKNFKKSLHLECQTSNHYNRFHLHIVKSLFLI